MMVSVRALLMCTPLPVLLVDPAMRLFAKLSTSEEDRTIAVAEILSDIREPLQVFCCLPVCSTYARLILLVFGF